MKRLKPAREGLRIIDPVRRSALPPEGAEVAMSPYWHRRILDGDVIECAPVSAPAKASPTPIRKTRSAKQSD
jgi:hypothetical protein